MRHLTAPLVETPFLASEQNPNCYDLTLATTTATVGFTNLCIFESMRSLLVVGFTMDEFSVNDDLFASSGEPDLLEQAAEIAALSQAGASDITLSSASAADKLLRSANCPAVLKEISNRLATITVDDSLPAAISLAVASDTGRFVALPNLSFTFQPSEVGALGLAVRGSTKSKYGSILTNGSLIGMVAGLALFLGPAAAGIFVMQELFMFGGAALMGGSLFAYSKRNIPWTVPLANAQMGQLQRLNELLETSGLTGRIRLVPTSDGIKMLIEAKS
jgi:hypothetical protein